MAGGSEAPGPSWEGRAPAARQGFWLLFCKGSQTLGFRRAAPGLATPCTHDAGLLEAGPACPAVLFLPCPRLLSTGDKALDGYSKKKYVCKLLFIFLLGHDIDFGHMEAVNLLSSNRYTEKQIVSARGWGGFLLIRWPFSVLLFLCTFCLVWGFPVGLGGSCTKPPFDARGAVSHGSALEGREERFLPLSALLMRVPDEFTQWPLRPLPVSEPGPTPTWFESQGQVGVLALLPAGRVPGPCPPQAL